MTKMYGLVVLAGVASTSLASVLTPGTLVGTATFTGVSSRDAQGAAGNDRSFAVIAGGGTVASVRAFGTLNRVATGTWASEARVRFSAGAGNTFSAFNYQHSSVGSYPTGGVVNFDTTTNVTPFALTAGGTVNFEWFESTQDGTAGLPESTFSPVTYEFRTAATITNGNFSVGAIGFGGSYNTAGSHVAGGLDFFTFSIPAVGNPGELLSIRMNAGTTAPSMTDTEIALYDGSGALVASNDDISALSFFSGLDLTTLAGGNYTLVTGGFNTVFPTTLSGTFVPGTNAGSYDLSIQLIPTPGALALVGMGGLVAARRRRA